MWCCFGLDYVCVCLRGRGWGVQAVELAHKEQVNVARKEVLSCVAVCRRALSCVTVCYRALPCVAACCRVLLRVLLWVAV